MAQVGNVPGHMEVPEFDRRFLDNFACGRLRRFLGQNNCRDGLGFRFGVGFANLRRDGFRFHVARDDVKDVVGRVFFAVIGMDVFRLQFVENVRIANDGEAIRAAGVSGFEQAAAGAAAGIVHVHVHLADDDFHFLGQFVGGQRGVLHNVAENVHGDACAGIGNVNVIDGAVERRVSVHITAGFLHLLINATAGACGGPLEQHVFEHVREAGPQPFAFVDAASHAPGLRGNDRGAVIFAHDDGQAVLQIGDRNAGRSGGDGVVRII